MGVARRPDKVKLIIGLLSRNTDLFPEIEKRMERTHGSIDFRSANLDFSHTTYYEEEMGPGLKRKFLSFARLIDAADSFKVKIRTNILERRFSENGRRIVNIDPGYLNLSKLILFSTKDYSHRVYLKNGIFAEVTLFYKDKGFNPWPWTYPDYKSREYADIFGEIRDIYKNSIVR